MDTNQTFMCHSGAISRLYCCGIISNLARNWSSNIFVILVDRIHRCAVSLKMCPFHLNCVVLDSTDELNVQQYVQVAALVGYRHAIFLSNLRPLLPC